MNRKERRAARSQDRRAGHASGNFALRDLFADAVRRHQAADFPAAERLYRDILERDAHHLNSLRNLGVLGLQTGRYELAIEMFGRLLALDPRIPDCQYNLGFALHALGRLDEAAEHYRQAIALKPDYVEALTNLGNVLTEQERFEAAAECYRQGIARGGESAELACNLGNVLLHAGLLTDAAAQFNRALVLRPDMAEAYNGLGNALFEQGRVDEALAQYRQAAARNPRLVQAQANIGLALAARGALGEAAAQLEGALRLAPEYPEAHNGLGLVRLAEGKAALAADAFRQALALRPRFAEAATNLGAALLALGQIEAALHAVLAALAMKDSAEAKVIFVQCARWLDAPPAVDGFDAALMRALCENWGPSGDLTPLASALFKRDPSVAACIRRAEQAWPDRLPAETLWGAEGLASVTASPWLLPLLEAERICDLQVEKFLTLARAAMLQAALDSGVPAGESDVLIFAGALAWHCYMNEYVFGCTDHERESLQRLQERISEGLRAGDDVPPLWLAVAAAYAPLGSMVPGAALAARTWPDPVQRLIGQQISEPEREVALKREIAALAPVADEVSRRVQLQYEQSPYPRWRGRPLVSRSRTIEHHVRAQLPAAQFDWVNPGRPPEVLVAGCGTGQQAIARALQFPDGRILAVDLSSASLAYAMRRTEELAVPNVEYMQADLLDIARLGRTFDVVEGVGVLHHLADPWQGWRTLVSVLRPGGVMLLGLYSERAREGVAAARGWIAERGWGDDPEQVRRARELIIASAEDPRLLRVLESEDFFTTSSCRDLLFHTRECVFRLPQIKAFLRQNGLQLLGMVVDPAVQQRFRSRFPDTALTDLERWDELEAEAPWIFARMYMFWIRKPAAEAVVGSAGESR